MKKISIIFMSAVAASMVMVSCVIKAKSNASEADMSNEQDTLTTMTMADDAVAPAAADEAATEATEVAAAEAEATPAEETAPATKAATRAADDQAFKRALMGLVDLPSNDKLDKYLKSLGFKGSSKKSTDTEPYLGGYIIFENEYFNYTFTSGEKTIKFIYDFSDSLASGGYTKEITVEGDKEALNDFYRAVKNSGEEVEKKGNTVILWTGWA